MSAIDPADYPPPVAAVLGKLPLAPLGPGKPRADMQAELKTALAAFPPGANPDMVAACGAGLWLAFDFLDESHAISQDLHTTEGSFWHAILHRREPDAWNSKYWWRRVGKHPVFADLARAAAALGYAGRGSAWDPDAFVDACEAHRDKGDATEEVLRRVQRAEWELLFAWCWGHSGRGQA
jgi:hypothetical protein